MLRFLWYSISYRLEVEIGNSSATLAEIGVVYDTNLDAHVITFRPDSSQHGHLETIAAQSIRNNCNIF